MMLPPDTAALIAECLSATYPRRWALDPVGLNADLQRSGLDQGDIAAVLSRRPDPQARQALGIILGRPITQCPPRTYALDWDDRPKSKPPSKRVVRTARRDPRIFVHVHQPNPHRPGTKAHNAYALYALGLTCDKVVARGARREDIRWDVSLGYIRLAPP